MIGQMLAPDIKILRAVSTAGLFASSTSFGNVIVRMASETRTKVEAQRAPVTAVSSTTPSGLWETITAELRHLASLMDLCRGVFIGVDTMETKKQLFGALAPLLFSAANFLHCGGPWALPRNTAATAFGRSGFFSPDGSKLALESREGVGGLPSMISVFLTPLHPHEFHRSDRPLADALRRELAGVVETAAASGSSASGQSHTLPPVPEQLHLARWGGQLRVAVYKFLASAVISGTVSASDERLTKVMTGEATIRALRHFPHAVTYAENFLTPVLQHCKPELLLGADSTSGVLQCVLMPFMETWGAQACELTRKVAVAAAAASVSAADSGAAGSHASPAPAADRRFYAPLLCPGVAAAPSDGGGGTMAELWEVAQKQQELQLVNVMSNLFATVMGAKRKAARWKVQFPLPGGRGDSVPLPVALCLLSTWPLAVHLRALLLAGLASAPAIAAHNFSYVAVAELLFKQLPAQCRTRDAAVYLVGQCGQAVLRGLLMNMQTRGAVLWGSGLDLLVCIFDAAGWKKGGCPEGQQDWGALVSEQLSKLLLQVAGGDKADVSFLHEAMGGQTRSVAGMSIGTGFQGGLGASVVDKTKQKSAGGPSKKIRRKALRSFLQRHAARLQGSRAAAGSFSSAAPRGAVLDIPMHVVGGSRR